MVLLVLDRDAQEVRVEPGGGLGQLGSLRGAALTGHGGALRAHRCDHLVDEVRDVVGIRP